MHHPKLRREWCWLIHSVLIKKKHYKLITKERNDKRQTLMVATVDKARGEEERALVLGHESWVLFPTGH